MATLSDEIVRYCGSHLHEAPGRRPTPPPDRRPLRGLQLHCQPIVRSADRVLVGAEALVRWYGSDRQVRSASEVLQAARESGRGHALDKLVVDKAIELIGTVVGMVSDSEPYLGVNVSPGLLAQRSFLPRIVDHLQAWGLDPSGLVLEARDHARVLMDPVAKSTVRDLQDLGILICLDDAGPGGGALATVRHLDLDVIKVSRRLTTRSHIPAVAESIGNLIEQAHRHGTRTIAVGAAGEREAQRLAKLGFDLLQGHHFGRPVSCDDFLDGLDLDAWRRGPGGHLTARTVLHRPRQR